MSTYTSFTGGRSVRFPAPDVARGWMLLLIALANVPIWLGYLDAAELTTADTVWMVVRGGLVDSRSYPLFSILFGYGLMTIVNRRVEARAPVEVAMLRQQTGLAEEAPLPPVLEQEAWRRARVDARRLVRRRGWWMLLFGAVHCLLFRGDIIGAYGFVAVVLAGWIAFKRRRGLALLAGGIAVAVVAFSVLNSWWVSTMSSAEASDASAESGQQISEMMTGLSVWTPLLNLALWLVNTPVAFVASMVVPGVVIGAFLADTDLVSRPDRHRGLLAGTAVAGLAVGFLGAMPQVSSLVSLAREGRAAVTASDLSAAGASIWAGALDTVTGVAGACGWLALLALLAGPPREGGLRGLRWVLAAVGKRSMTAYLGQTILFVTVFGASMAAGVRAWSQVAAAGVAVAVWVTMAVLCVWLEARGAARGPFELLLRRAVARSARPEPLVPPPYYVPGGAGAPAVPAVPGGPGVVAPGGPPCAPGPVGAQGAPGLTSAPGAPGPAGAPAAPGSAGPEQAHGTPPAQGGRPPSTA